MKIWRVPYPKFGAGPGLERTARIAAQLGVDLAAFGESGAGIIGSNGKGSTAAMAAAMLRETGRSVGLFTSPHLFDLNERFRIDDNDITDDELAHHWTRVADAAQAAGEHDKLGGFEFLFLIAADWFAARGCAHTIWEAGIGGRLDPVRLIEARRLALTALDFEHVKILGSTLEDIAREKIAAAPKGAAVFVSKRCAFMREAIEAFAAEHDARAIFIGEDALGGLSPPLHGDFQRSNAALALALAKDIAQLDEAALARGLAATRWPGRLEVLSKAPLVVIDVGHTPDGVRAALKGFQTLREGRDAVLVCGVSSDKDIASIAGALAPSFSTIVCVAAHKGAPAAVIAGHVQNANPEAEIILAESTAEARRLALARAGEDGAVYAAGGLFLAAEFRAVHHGRDPDALVFF